MPLSTPESQKNCHLEFSYRPVSDLPQTWATGSGGRYIQAFFPYHRSFQCLGWRPFTSYDRSQRLLGVRMKTPSNQLLNSVLRKQFEPPETFQPLEAWTAIVWLFTKLADYNLVVFRRLGVVWSWLHPCIIQIL